MLRNLSVIAVSLVLLVGCQGNNVKSYWNNHRFNFDDVQTEQDFFADFAELAVASPQKDALAGLDRLFNKLKKDEVAYYVYLNWINGAFYSVYSPCRSVSLYSRAVERIVSDGILSESECEPYLQKREWIQYNTPGSLATVPGVIIGGTRTLVLVLDKSCPSCKEALNKFALNPEWADARRIAVCCGYGRVPEVPGWEYTDAESLSAVFDPQLTPVYFVVGADGIVETGYRPAL